MNLQLFHNEGFKWFHKDGMYVKGYLYDSGGKYYKEEELVTCISKFDSKSLIEFIKVANGTFAIVWQKENEVVVLVDRIRSIPIFYYLDKEELIISDDVYYISKYKHFESFDGIACNFVQFGGFTPGNKTLFPTIFQLIGGQFLHIENILSSLQSEPLFYYEHIHNRYKQYSQDDLERKFLIVLNNTFNRLIQSMENKTVVIPLSGGLDSRLIAVMLKKLNYERVICYTYGRPDSYETKIAKEVANELNYPWYFIDYDFNLFEQYFTNTARQFRMYIGNFACSPQEQESFAVLELIKRKLIPEDSVFVPGYCGDLPAGSYFPDKMQLKLINQKGSGLAEFIIEKHFKKYREKLEFSIIEAELFKLVSTVSWNNLDEFISEHENWFTLNKVSKYVVNGIRTFEYFGYEWRLPLWDNEFIDFFYSIPNEERIDKKFYKNYLSNLLFKQYHIDLTPEIFDNYFTYNSPLTNFKYFVPKFIRRILKPILIKKKDRDVNALSELFEGVNQKIYNGYFDNRERDINHILACWYLKETNMLIKGNS